MIPAEYLIGAAVVVGVTAYILFGSEGSSGWTGFQAFPNTSAPTSGLMNLGRTCFFNAVLQALASCHSFSSWLNVKASTATKYKRFLELLRKMINDLDKERTGDVPHDTRILAALLDEIRAHGWVVENDEHDAHELFQAIMNLLHSGEGNPYSSGLDVIDTEDNKECEDGSDKQDNEMTIAHKSHIRCKQSDTRRSPLMGFTAANMTCRTCMKKSITKYETFTSLSLTFPPTPKGSFRLDDLLKYYFLSDNLSDVDCQNCSKKHQTHVKSNFLKEVSLGRIPRCLCLHIQRLGWYGYHEALKRHDRVIFPSLLDLSHLTQLNKMLKSSANRMASAAFSGDSHRKLEGAAAGQSSPPEGTTTAGQSSPPEGITAAGQSSPPITNWYKLMALIEHQGSETSGHFVTYRRVDKNSDRWIYTSDMNVREVTAEQVHKRAPYMLFYERYDPLLETT